jgi:cobalt/nickel transport system permease protein
VHVPDGFLDARTCAGTYGAAIVGLTWATSRVTRQWSDRTIPMMGVMSAFVFAGQMVNFPVAGGTSGHLLGAVLAGTLLGPAAASVTLSTVLMIQCLLFQDGGITALGANILNLSLVATLGGHGIRRALERLWPGATDSLAPVAVAAWCSVVLASAVCAVELALAGTAPVGLALPAMVGTHALIGVGEAMITVAVLRFVLRLRPDLKYEARSISVSAAARGPRPFPWGYAVALCLGVALFLAPLASTSPDGLERIAEQLGFSGRAKSFWTTPLGDYRMPGVASETLQTSMVGFLGTVLALAVAMGVAWLIGRGWRRRRVAPGGNAAR